MIDHNRLNILCEKLMKEFLTSEEHTEVKAELNKLIELREKITKALAGAPYDDPQRKNFLKLLFFFERKDPEASGKAPSGCLIAGMHRYRRLKFAVRHPSKCEPELIEYDPD
jgi:hypothetical protein